MPPVRRQIQIDPTPLVLFGNVTAEEASPVSNATDPVTTQRHRSILNSLDDNSPRIERQHSNGKYADQEDNEVPPSPVTPRSIDRVRTHQQSPSHPSRSSPSPTSTHSSRAAYVKSTEEHPPSATASVSTDEKKGAIGTVRFLGTAVHNDDTDAEETYF